MSSSTESSPVTIVKKLLANATNPDVVNELVHPQATYVSLNYHNPQLHTIMPWCGTHTNAGPSAILETFIDVDKHWENKNFEIRSLFGGKDDAGKDQVAAFGTMTYMGRVTKREETSPWAYWCTVEDGKIVYSQFMEDTFATARSFEIGGEKRYRSDPGGRTDVL